MSWNYRVIKFKNEDLGEHFEIKEVFYDKNGKPKGFAEASVFGETYDDLFKVMAMIRMATAKPVLVESDFLRGD
jgi:hypothetical protein